MSQNTQTLLLFCDDAALHKQLLLMFFKLSKGERDAVETIAQKLSIDVESSWDDDWFNHEVSVDQAYILISYDTSTHYSLPLTLLQQMFKSGLQGAVIEVFHSMVGEMSRHYFLEGKLVDEGRFFSAVPLSRSIVEEKLDEDYEPDGGDLPDTPVAISTLIKDEVKQEVDAVDVVNVMQDIMALAKESKGNPVETLEAVMLIRAGLKGLLHAALFALATILLFKGLWLWVIVSVVLAVVLPLFHMHKVLALFKDDEDGSDVMDEEPGYAD